MVQDNKKQKLFELNKYRETLVAKLDELKAKRAELNSELENSSSKEANKYRQFGDQLINTDPDMANKFYTQADQLDAADKPSESGTDPQTIRMKLFSSANSMSNQMSKMTQGSINFNRAKRMQNWMYEESSKKNPTLQMPLSVINGTKTPDIPAPGGNTSVDPTSLEVQSKVTAVENPVVKEKLNNLKPDTTVSANSIQRGGDISKIAGDWYEMQEVDGYEKPVLRESSISLETMPKDVLDRYNTALENWENNNNTRKAADKEAGNKAKGSELAKRFGNNFAKLAASLRSESGQLASLKDFFVNGDYSLANFTRLKTTMADGRMTESDVGLALGLSTEEGILQGLLQKVTSGNVGVKKLQDKDTAAKAINLLIDMYNKRMDMVLNPKFTGKYKDYAEQAYIDNSYATSFSSLPKSYDKVKGGNKTTNVVLPDLVVKDGEKYWKINMKNKTKKPITIEQFNTYKTLGVSSKGE